MKTVNQIHGDAHSVLAPAQLAALVEQVRSARHVTRPHTHQGGRLVPLAALAIPPAAGVHAWRVPVFRHTGAFVATVTLIHDRNGWQVNTPLRTHKAA